LKIWNWYSKTLFLWYLKIILNDKYWINWYISDNTATDIQNKSIDKYPNNIEIRTINGKSMNFLLIDLPAFKVNILNRTDKYIWNVIYDEFKWMRVKYEEYEFWLKIDNNVKQANVDSISSISREGMEGNKVLKIIVDEWICDIEDLLYLSELKEKDLNKNLDKLIKEKLIYKKKKNYSIFKDFISNKESFKHVFNYFDKEDRKKRYIKSSDDKFYKKIYNLDFNLKGLNKGYIKDIKQKYKKLKINWSFLKKEKLDMIFKSAELEWFWWTYADTKKLIEENIKPLWMNEKDKNILLNIKDSFDLIIKTDWNVNIVDVNNLIQRNITDDDKLGIRRKGIDVKINNSVYHPMKWKDIYAWWYDYLIKEINSDKYNDIENAFKALMLISFTQAFYDWNKRTARIISNGFLYKNNLPFVNFSSIEKVNYDKSIVAFYETWDLWPFKKCFYQSFMQGVIRVNEFEY